MRHPIIGDNEIHRKTYEALCNKIRRFYAVPDAEQFFAATRRSILDKCTEDPFGWARYATLKDWHEAKVLAARLEPSNAEFRGVPALSARPLE